MTDKVPPTLEHNKNSIGKDACFIRMSDPPYHYVHVASCEGAVTDYKTKEGYFGAVVIRDEKEARRMIWANNLVGYVPVPCWKVIEDDGSMN